MRVFRLSLQFNDSYAFRDYPRLTDNQRNHQDILPDMSGSSRRGILRCSSCGELLNKWNEPLSGLVVTKRQYDIGSTYDGIVLVSERFKSAYAAAGLSGLMFQQLPDDARFFATRAGRAVKFDAERRSTRFINQCSACHHFESVVGATPVYLKFGSEIGPSEFVRTDLEFGSNDEKHPLLLCGENAAKALGCANLKGLDLIALDDLGSTAPN